ncbi:MAG: PKD domain-containing protein [Reichenbachiella sp.]|uniref:PKD domain-containing protein n=1 Tax=Reichenbachiella sp. TaxID=2184521 RepID=UPI0032641B71
MNNKRDIILTVLFLIVQSGIAYAQEPDPAKDAALPDLNPKTPTVAQFLRFGNLPVNEYNGVPNISIPLYTIKERGIDLPIAIRYNAEGIRVTQEASWVGLGWDLQFGSIVQNINGYNDFVNPSNVVGQMDLPDYIPGPPPLPYMQTLLPQDFYASGNTPNGEFSTWAFHREYQPQNGQTAYMDQLLYFGNRDSQPDIMTANFLGHSLKFMIDPKTQNVVCLNKKGYIIRKMDLVEEIGWEITTPDGDIFKFEQSTNLHNYQSPPRRVKIDEGFDNEAIPNINVSLAECDASGFTTEGDCSSPDQPQSSRIWKITEILTTEGGHIKFNYKNDRNYFNDATYQLKWNVYNAIEGSLLLAEKTTLGGFVYSGGPYESYEGSYTRPKSDGLSARLWRSNIWSCTEYSSLSSIDFSGGSVEFFTDSNVRLDRYGDEQLNQIIVKNFDGTPVKRIDFDYSYFNSDYRGTGWCSKNKTEQTKRLKLEGVSIDNESYYFAYNSESLPPKNSFATDYWGYYNGKINNASPLPNILRIADASQLEYPELGSLLSQNDSDHSSSLKYSQAGILECINYPTGGYTSFEYELNKFDNIIVPNIDFGYDPSQVESVGAGLRLKRQKSQLDPTAIVAINEYEYSGGRLSQPMKFFYEFTESVKYERYLGTDNILYFNNWDYETISVSSTNNYITNAAGDGNRVGYGSVKALGLDNEGISNGYLIKNFSNATNKEFINNYDHHRFSLPSIPDHNQYPRGLELSIEVYDKNDVKVRETVNDYDILINSDFYYGVRHSFMGKYSEPVGWNSTNFQGGEGGRYLVGYYPIYSTDAQLKSSIVSDHTAEGTITKETYYYYDSRNRMASNKTYLNKAKTRFISNTFLYSDYAPVLSDPNLTEEEKDVIRNLTTSNRLNEVILSKQNTEQATILQVLKSYQETNGMILPKAVKTKFSSAVYTPRVMFDLFDDKGNILQYTTGDGVTKSYLWGYNQTVPAAEIINATYPDVKNALGEISEYVDLANAGLSSSQEQLLRANLPEAHVTIFKHKPMIGVTEVADENERDTYFEYDHSNRLSTVKDHDLNITEHYRYKYHGAFKNLDADFRIVTTPISAGTAIQFELIRDNTEFGDTQYTWNFGDGTIINGGKTITHTFTNGGNYNVNLTLTNPNYITQETTKLLEVYECNLTSLSICGPHLYNPCLDYKEGTCQGNDINDHLTYNIVTSIDPAEKLTYNWSFRYTFQTDNTGWSSWIDMDKDQQSVSVHENGFSYVSGGVTSVARYLEIKCQVKDICGNIIDSNTKSVFISDDGSCN